MPISGASKNRLPLSVTLGDPGGIGPEVALMAAWSARAEACRPICLVGDHDLAAATALRLRLPLPETIVPDEARPAAWPPVSVWDPDRAVRRRARRWRTGATNAAHGRAAAAWVAAATAGCLRGWFRGMVTAPLCKQSMAAAGLAFPGHTEYIAHLAGVRRFGMMLLAGRLRVVLATRHLPLRKVADALTVDAVVEAGQLAAQALPWLGWRRTAHAAADLAVCALNPHAGDGGLLGREESRVIVPALRRLRRAGADVAGPLPADAVFHHARQGLYGAVLAMYHDQGLAPLKTMAFDRGVNVTLGLPLVRTSPDHGTAFALAGKNQASAASMLAALRLAGRLARRANPWRHDGAAQR